MIRTKWTHQLSLAATAVALSLASCSSSSDNPGKAPRVGAIPAQEALGGQVFSLDLSTHVTDPTGALVTYTVNSGGGAVAGSTYSQRFETVGNKTVQLTASNGTRSTTFSFKVAVNTGYEAVVKAGTGLMLLDRGSVADAAAWVAGQLYSAHFMTVSNSQGFADTFKAALTRGHTIYERVKAGQTDLFVFNPFDRTTVQLGDDPNSTTDEKFEAKTSDHRVVFTSGSSTDPDLFIYNAMTGLTRKIRGGVNSYEHNARVDAGDLVYFESGPLAQRDIYVYDPSKDELDPVSTNAKNEVIVGTVTGGGVVFTRDEGAGDIDLWFYKPGVGLTQVASDVATAGFQDRTLTFNGSTSSGKVVFTEIVSGTDVNLYYWDPTTLTTTTVAANVGDNDVFNGVTTNDKIVYTHEVTASDWDVHAYTVGSGDVNLSGASAAQDVFQAITKLDDVVMFRDADEMYVWDDSAATLLGADTGGAQALTLAAALDGGNIVYGKADGSLHRWETGNTTTQVNAAAAFAGAMENGADFVFKTTVSAQDDLSFWNETTDGATVISANAADEEFVASAAADSAVVFSRLGTGANYDLYVWDATNGVRQLTSTSLDHEFCAQFFLDNR